MRRGSAALLAFVVGAASLGLAASVAAQTFDEKPVALEWIAPAECPDSAYVERELARLLAGDPVAAERRLRVRAEVGRADAGRWRVRIRTSGAGGTGDRSLDAESCRALADATALIVALAVDPARVAANRATPTSSASTAPVASSAPPVASSAPPPSASAPPPPVASSAAPIASTSRPPRPRASAVSLPPALPSPPTVVTVGLAGVLDSATLPHATAGGQLMFGVVPGGATWLRIDASAALFAGASTGVGTARGGDFALRTFDLGACIPIAIDGWELGPCAGGELAWVVGKGNGASSPDTGTVWIPRLRGGGAFAVRIASPLYLRGDLGVAAGLTRPEFIVGGIGGGLVHRPAALSARAGLGIELRF